MLTLQVLTIGLQIANWRDGAYSKMSWKIETLSDGRRTTLRLVGRMQVQHLRDLQLLIDESGPAVALDLEELALVDLEAVRFLGHCQSDGVSLLRCSQYIREWIAREQDKSK